MEQKRIKVRLTKDSPYSDYGYYKKGDIGYIDGYVNDDAVIILENGKFAKADLRWIEVANEEDKNVNTELAESEDERVRKEIILYLKSVISNKKFGDKSIESWVAWLEKQGQKPQGKSALEAIKEEKVDNQNCVKPAAWSEEDEKTLQGIWDEILANKHDAKEYEWKTYDRFLDWLKSLKDRVQPKQEWSEENDDEAWLNDIICKVESDCTLNKDEKDWLKSLRLHNRWKPSDEQMDMLAKVCSTLHLTSGENEIMESIYDDLKKLKG